MTSSSKSTGGTRLLIPFTPTFTNANTAPSRELTKAESRSLEPKSTELTPRNTQVTADANRLIKSEEILESEWRS